MRDGTLSGNLAGTLNAGASSFAITVASGTLIFAPLGTPWIAPGIVAAIVAAVAGGTISALLSPAPMSVSSPRASASIVLAGFVATLHRSVPELDPALVVAIAGLVVFGAGIIQVAAALCRLGRLIRFVPFPVLSGFTHGIALALLLVYTPIALGISELPRLGWPTAGAFHWGAPLLAAGALLGITAAGRFGKRAPAMFLGIVAGVAAHLVLGRLVPGFDPGPVINPGIVPYPISPAMHAGEIGAALADPVVLRLAAAFCVALAAVTSIDTTLGAMVVETQFNVRSNPDGDLIAQGVGNAISGLLGGAANAISVVQVQAAYSAGGRSRYVGPASSLVLAALAIACAVALDSVSLAVLAALMMFAARRLADPWGIGLLRTIARDGLRTDMQVRENFTVYLLVALSLVFVDVVAALAVGLVASIVIFIRAMNRSVVRTVALGPEIRSRRIYPRNFAKTIADGMNRVAIIELEGPLFFGTADRIGSEVERLPLTVGYVLLDLRRVHALDATAATVLVRASARLESAGRTLLLSGRLEELQSAAQHLPHAFIDRDRAIEWVEERLIAEADTTRIETRVEPSLLVTHLGLDASEGEKLLAIASTREHAAGDYVFREGDTSDELYLVLSGRVSIYMSLGREPGTRVVTFMPGNLFGDVAFVDGHARTASVVCDVPCRVLSLSRAALDRLGAESPSIATKTFAALAVNIAGRLRATNALLHEELEG